MRSDSLSKRNRIPGRAGHLMANKRRTVRPCDESLQQDLIVPDPGETADRRAAGAIQGIEHGPFGLQAGQSIRIVQGHKRLRCGAVPGQAGNGDHPLPGRGQHLLGLQDRIGDISAPQPVQPGQRQKRCIRFAGLEFAQSGLYISPEQNDAEVRAVRQQLRLTPLGCRADTRTLGQSGDRVGADQRITRVFPLQCGGNRDALGQPGFHVLGRVHRDIDLPCEERPVDFLGEKALAARIRQRPVGDDVTGGLNHHNVGRRRFRMGGGQQIAHRHGLGQRERTAARPDAERGTDHAHLLAEPAGKAKSVLQTRACILRYIGSMIVLGIETSCDETAAAIVRDDDTGAGKIVSNVVLSQLDDHRAFGGVVPEIAARAHLEHLDAIVARALDEAGLDLAEIDGIAATAGPGLIGGVHVGTITGKAIASARGLPFVAVNHLEAHALTARLTNDLAFPHLLLLVSGGHCQLLAVEALGQYTLLGTTIDDAIGEAFDKTAKLLGLGFPGGPAVQEAAAHGDPKRFSLPRPLKGREGCDFSFSGLKTAVRQAALKLDDPAPRQDIHDLAAGFQAAVCDTVADRCRNAFDLFAQAHDGDPPALVAAGGVAANLALRETLETICVARGVALVVPPPALCTDNAAMVAWAGLERLRAGITSPMDFRPRPRWPLAELSAAE